MRWGDLEREVPDLAKVMHERLIAPGVLLVATIRRDGTPRLSPVEPLILDRDLWLSMLWRSRKATDLLRDDRVLVHSITTNREGGEGEVKVRGRAIPIDDATSRSHYCDAVAVLGWRPEEPYFHLFRIDIGDVTLIRYAKTGDQYVERWPSGDEYVRREATPTSLGHKEPVFEILRAERGKGLP